MTIARVNPFGYVAALVIAAMTAQPLGAGMNDAATLGITGVGPIAGSSTAVPRLWLKADAGITADGNGRVSRWADQSGNARDAVQTLLSQQPLFVASAMNGQPALRFDGVANVLRLPDATIPTGNSSYTVIMAVRLTDFASNRGLFGSGDGALRAGVFAKVLSTGRILHYWWGADDLWTPDALNAGGTYVLTFRYDNTAGKGAWINGRLSATQPSITRNGTATSNVLGAINPNGGEGWKGEIAEVQVFDTALTDADRTSIEDALINRFVPFVALSGASVQSLGCGAVMINHIDTRPGLDVTSVSVNWGDGSTSSGQPAYHQYQHNGTYAVVATAVTSQGTFSTDPVSISVTDADNAICANDLKVSPGTIYLRDGHTSEHIDVWLENRVTGAVSRPAVTFTSSTPSVVTVDSNGNVQSSSYGESWIDVAVAGFPARRVKVFAGSFKLSPPMLVLTTGQTAQLSIDLRNADGTAVMGATVSFSGGNAVASVSSAGVVTAIRPPQSFGETPYINASFANGNSDNGTVVRVLPRPSGLSFVTKPWGRISYTIAQIVGPNDYSAIFDTNNAAQITDLAYDSERELAGLKPSKGGLQFLVNDVYFGLDGSNSGPCGLSGNPVRLGTDLDKTYNNSCLIVADYSPSNVVPQWGVFFHEMGHNFTLGSSRFGTFALNSEVSSQNTAYVEAMASNVALYVAGRFNERRPAPLTDAFINSLLPVYFHSTSDLDQYVAAGANYGNLNVGVVYDILALIAKENGLDALQRFYSVFYPAEAAYPFDVNGSVRQANFFAAALSAATGRDLRLRFRGWGYPIDDGMFDSFRAYLRPLVLQREGGPNAPATPQLVNAWATTATSVRVSWSGVAAADAYRVIRRSATGTMIFTLPASPIGYTGDILWDDSSASPNTAYLYSVRSVAAGTVSPESNSDLATTVAFTDDPVVARSTIIKATHLIELRTAANAVRALAGMPPVTWARNVSSGVVVSATDLSEIRSALDPPRSAVAMPPATYSTAVAGGGVITANDMNETRAALK